MSDEPRWVARQKRMFTRVANAYMRLEGLEIGDIYTDLKDGVNLIRFLEILSSSKLGKYTKTPKMDIHRQENLKVVFTFLKANDVPLMNIGAEDIFKGASRRRRRRRRRTPPHPTTTPTPKPPQATPKSSSPSSGP